MDRPGLLKKLQELNISCETLEHSAVLTCDAQVRLPRLVGAAAALA